MSSRRFDPVLLIGDAVSFLVFAALGRTSHETGLSPAAVVGTALPFLVVWYPVGVWLRVFRPEAAAGPLIAARRILLPWLLAWPLALQLRALILDRSIPFSFAAVVFATNLVLLAGWRAVYARLRRPPAG